MWVSRWVLEYRETYPDTGRFVTTGYNTMAPRFWSGLHRRFPASLGWEESLWFNYGGDTVNDPVRSQQIGIQFWDEFPPWARV